MRKKYKGGTSTTVAPLLSYPLEDGAASQRESAMMTSSNMNAKQQAQINQHGGSKCPYLQSSDIQTFYTSQNKIFQKTFQKVYKRR